MPGQARHDGMGMEASDHFWSLLQIILDLETGHSFVWYAGRRM